MLLHDCGTTLGADAEAPQNMLIALEKLLRVAQERQLRSVRVDTLFCRQSVNKPTASEMSSTGWLKERWYLDGSSMSGYSMFCFVFVP